MASLYNALGKKYREHFPQEGVEDLETALREWKSDNTTDSIAFADLVIMLGEHGLGHSPESDPKDTRASALRGFLIKDIESWLANNLRLEIGQDAPDLHTDLGYMEVARMVYGQAADSLAEAKARDFERAIIYRVVNDLDLPEDVSGRPEGVPTKDEALKAWNDLSAGDQAFAKSANYRLFDAAETMRPSDPDSLIRGVYRQYQQAHTEAYRIIDFTK
jgi:hypothetical protein